MNEAKFRIIDIAPLMPSHKDGIVKDLLRLRDECGVTDVAFMLPLVPEGEAPTNAKAEHLRDLFLEMRKPLEGSGLKIGILIQSAIGHGTATDAKFQRSVNAKGWSGNNMCPLDTAFQDYVRKAVETVASTKPDFLLVDDDFRLANGGAPGCFCSLHLSELEKAAGRKFDRESLLKAMEVDASLKDIWDKVKRDSLLTLARKIREGIDAIDPSLPCGFCVCDAGGMELQYARPIEDVLGGDNPQFVRVNTACYMTHDTRGMLWRLYWTSAQMERLKGIPEILAESDTYPQNRYCTPAKALDAQIVFSVLHGCTGLKLWVTRFDDFQPDSGEAYRQILKQRIGFYRKLREIMQNVKWDGIATPLPSNTAALPSSGTSIRSENWCNTAFGHMGIPCRVSSKGNVFALTAPECELFSDDEIKGLLSKGVLLDGPAAESLCKRGFGELLGIEATSPDSFKVSFERANTDPLNGASAGRRINIAALMKGSAVKLTPVDGKVQTLSTFHSIPFYLSPDETPVGPGLTLFENILGGRVAVYAAALGFTPFMNEIRREQLFSVLGWLNRKALPVVVSTDVDVYAMHGEFDDEELLAVFNLNMDSLSELPLRLGGKTPLEISLLGDNGHWKKLNWRKGPSEDIIVETRLESVEPLVLRIRR